LRDVKIYKELSEIQILGTKYISPIKDEMTMKVRYYHYA